MRMYDLIDKKRRGEELTDGEIDFIISGYTDGSIPDYQVSALLMAICFAGMSDRETVALTKAMRDSGDTVDLSAFGGITVDKHSTGGVGDKTTLIVTPILAALGAKVAKMSGRGLGHTGGTVDKLESVKGFKVTMSADEFLSCVRKTGICVVGQSGNLAPADKKLYALRDVTATVQSIPLIASSIMSKKLAAGTDTIVLDVKTGSGAFMKTPEDAKLLARKMVDIGKDCGKKVCALVTDMDVPLGSAVGNAVEILEASRVLSGDHTGAEDLYEVCVALASHMASLCLGISLLDGRKRVIDCLSSGKAFDKFKEWISAQGGDIGFTDCPESIFAPKYTKDIKICRDGYIAAMDTEAIGKVCVILGAGREKKEDPIDYSAGIMILKKTGDRVNSGDTVARIFTSSENVTDIAEKAYLSALTFGDTQTKRAPLIYCSVQ